MGLRNLADLVCAMVPVRCIRGRVAVVISWEAGIGWSGRRLRCTPLVVPSRDPRLPGVRDTTARDHHLSLPFPLSLMRPAVRACAL
jgi:hypothetical protein